MRYRKLYYRDADHPGWHTYDSAGMSSGSRYVLWGDLIEAIHLRAITVPNGEGLSQFLSLIHI